MNALMPQPTSPFDRLNQMLEETFGPKFEMNLWRPAVDIKETEKEYFITVDLPGFKREDLDVEVSGDRLTISGKREMRAEEKSETYIRRERHWGEFKRSFKLDMPVQPESVKGDFKEGVLMVTVPKIEAMRPHKVEVRV